MKFLLTIGALSVASILVAMKSTDAAFRWERVVDPGHGSFPDKWRQGTWPMAIEPIQFTNDSLYMIGDDRMWSSADGVTWSVFEKTDWGHRYGAAIEVFKNRIVVTGGMKSWDAFLSDVWISQNGRSWQKFTAPWPQRRGHNMVVFKNKLLIFGGLISSGKPDQTPTRAYTDAWSSDDGITWTQELQTVPWQVDQSHTILSHKDKLFMVSTGSGEVWSSIDGKNWSVVTAKAAWPIRERGGAVLFDNKIWVYGGTGLNDVWYSHDGKSWEQQTPAAPWSARSTQYSGVFRDKLWIYSGKTGRDDSWSGDVWVMTILD